MPPLGQNTAEDFLRGKFEPIEEDPRISQCRAKGGTWNPETQQCDLTIQQKVEENAAIRAKEEVIQDQEPTGPALLTEEEKATTQGIIITDAQGNQRIQTPEDTRREEAEFGGIGAAQALQEKQQQQQRAQQQIEQIGQLGKLTAAQEADINLSQAITAGAAGSIPSILGGAAIGALRGGTIAGVPGVVAGAGLGAIGGFVGGIIGNIKEQQRGELQAADIELTNARTNMRQLAMLASQDPANADVYISQYNQQLTRIHQARRQTKAEVSGDLNAWMEDGREQLADFDAFLQAGGIADVYGQKLAIALSRGVPLSINGEGLLE